MAPDQDNEERFNIADRVSDLDPDGISKYWRVVHKALTKVFGKSDNEASDAINDLQKRLGTTTPDTQIHFYHADPFQIAADIARPGTAVSPAEKDSYLKVLIEENPDQPDWPKSGSLRREVPDDPPAKD